MQDSLNRDFFRMAEILNTRFNYETLLYENKIHVNKKLQKLTRHSVRDIIKYFNNFNSNKDVGANAVALAEYYIDILQYEALEII